MFCPPLRGRATTGTTCAVVGTRLESGAYTELIGSYQRVWRVENVSNNVMWERQNGSNSISSIVSGAMVRGWASQSADAPVPALCRDRVCKLYDTDTATLQLLDVAQHRFPMLRIQVDNSLRRLARLCKHGEQRSLQFLATVLALGKCRMPVGLFGFGLGNETSQPHEDAAINSLIERRFVWVAGAQPPGVRSLPFPRTTRRIIVVNRSMWKRKVVQPSQDALPVPRFFSSNMRKLPLPAGGLFVSCVNAMRRLCAFRENAGTRRVFTIKGIDLVANISNADDPRMFTHRGAHWVLNNNYYGNSMIELHRNGSVGRQISVPIMQSKNLAPISWSDTHFFMLDIQEAILWPAVLDDKATVLIRRPMNLVIKRVESDLKRCKLPAACSARGGTQGVHLNPTDDRAYGAGHCTGHHKRGRERKLQHHSFWWILDLPKRELEIHCLQTSGRALVDPTALYPMMRRGVDENNQSWSQLIWALATTEADEEWNRRSNQRYYNQMYRAEMPVVWHPPIPPPPPYPPPPAPNMVIRIGTWWKGVLAG